MCRYQEASQACAIAAQRAEYTARVSSAFAAGVDDQECQTVAEAGALIDEWVAVKDGLQTAQDVLTLVATNPKAWEAFCANLNAPVPMPPPRRPLATAMTPPGGLSVSKLIQSVRGL